MRMSPKLSESERWQLWERHLLGCSEGLSQPLAVYHEDWVRKGRSVGYAVSVLPAIASEREVLEEEGPTPFEQALPRGARNDEEEAFLRSVAPLRVAPTIVIERVAEQAGAPLGVVQQPGLAVSPLGIVPPQQVVPRPASAPPGGVRVAQQAVAPQGKAGRFPKAAPPAFLLERARMRAEQAEQAGAPLSVVPVPPAAELAVTPLGRGEEPVVAKPAGPPLGVASARDSMGQQARAPRAPPRKER